MSRNYPSDLDDKQWELLTPLIPRAKTKPRTVDMRLIINGILYVKKSGCQWAMLPKDFGHFSSFFYYFNKFAKDGTWDKISEALVVHYRERRGKEAKPTAGIIDSQSVKSSEIGGVRGYDAGKKNQRAQAVFIG